MTKFTIFFASLTMFACGMTPVAHTAPAPIYQNESTTLVNICYRVAVDRLNLRAAPMGATDPDGLIAGDVLARLSRDVLGWMKVMTADGRTGWVNADLVEACK